MPATLYKDFDFSIIDDPDFHEDSVREELILPILKYSHYSATGRSRIIRSKSIHHPFVQIGTSKRNIRIIPDYLLEVNGKFKWVLDAKAPGEEILSGENREQVYFYAIHPEIRVNYYALCNGREFVVFNISRDQPELMFNLKEIEFYKNDLLHLLSPDAFLQKEILDEKIDAEETYSMFDYVRLSLPKPIVVRKQAAKRHFGVHGYFTKQAWNVVQHYIVNFTKPGDLILDPFGGSGITLVEALMNDRRAIHIDLNPLSVFITKALIAPVDIDEMNEHFCSLKEKFINNCPETDSEISAALKKYDYPKGIKMTSDADVEYIEDLFTPRQLAQLAYLKSLIIKIKNENIRISLLLSFSSTVTKINRTYHPSKSRGDNAGDSAAFRYYRYRIAKNEVHLSLIETFETKYKKLLSAKIDMRPKINEKTIKNATVLRGDATNLSEIDTESIDYIYTDPPYGAKIAYLDLSTMWNAWLGFKINEQDFENEAIEGGSRNKSLETYTTLLELSIREMYRVLKFDRWMSFIFNHKNPKYWHLIIEAAESAGFEYAGAVKQSNGQSSFKKRQNPFSVLSGQLILNFKKVKTPQTILKVNLGAEIYDLIIETIESVIAEHDGATLEQINDELILKGLELGFLDVLSREYKDLTPILIEHFKFDESDNKFHILEEKRFKTNIPLDMRIRYFLLSYLKRNEKNGIYPTTDDLLLDIMPLLKNGITPENQTILKVLESIAIHIGQNRWKLSTGGQITMFD
jgi:16S rRNA G966 N2-methylase RsmD